MIQAWSACKNARMQRCKNDEARSRAQASSAFTVGLDSADGQQRQRFGTATPVVPQAGWSAPQAAARGCEHDALNRHGCGRSGLPMSGRCPRAMWRRGSAGATGSEASAPAGGTLRCLQSLLATIVVEAKRLLPAASAYGHAAGIGWLGMLLEVGSWCGRPPGQATRARRAGTECQPNVTLHAFKMQLRPCEPASSTSATVIPATPHWNAHAVPVTVYAMLALDSVAVRLTKRRPAVAAPSQPGSPHMPRASELARFFYRKH
jgi:hypothetical protein